MNFGKRSGNQDKYNYSKIKKMEDKKTEQRIQKQWNGTFRKRSKIE